MNVIAFTKVSAPFGWLGNMSPHLIAHGEKMWKTTEALFQALRFSDGAIREKIRAERSPMSAKMVAKANRSLMVIEPQSTEDLSNMVLVLTLKIEQHPSLREALRATGEAQIIEDVTKRPGGSGLFWGAAKQADGSWKGENHLGRLWMGLREELI